jgi:cbb3-type cytochrome oxidase maturation protein
MALIIASALFVGLTSLAVLLWALSSGQYEDLDGDAQRILLDDDLMTGDQTK